MQAISIIGFSNSGKTTLISRLSECLEARGLKVAIAKHTHHELDKPDTDTALLMGPKRTIVGLSNTKDGKGEAMIHWGHPCFLRDLVPLLDADILLVETVFDTLNAKAALYAIDTLCAKLGRRIPVMVSGTLADASGRTLSGQTVEAFAVSVSHANLLSVGLNCAYGAKQLLPYLERLAAVAGRSIGMSCKTTTDIRPSS